MSLEIMEKGEWKIGEKNDGIRLFSLWAHLNLISPKLEENRSKNSVQNFGLKYPPTCQCSQHICCFFLAPFVSYNILGAIR